jgi:K+-sensing histidine kinase KdpD
MLSTPDPDSIRLTRQSSRRFTRPSAHLGIGLSICQAIAEQHGGTILAEASDRDAKACFALPGVFNFESNVRTDQKAAKCVFS